MVRVQVRLPKFVYKSSTWRFRPVLFLRQYGFSTDKQCWNALDYHGLSLALLIASEEQTTCGPNCVAKVADQLFGLLQIRLRGVDTGEFEGITDLRARRVCVPQCACSGHRRWQQCPMQMLFQLKLSVSSRFSSGKAMAPQANMSPTYPSSITLPVSSLIDARSETQVARENGRRIQDA